MFRKRFNTDVCNVCTMPDYWSRTWNFSWCDHKHNALTHPVGSTVFAHRNKKGKFLTDYLSNTILSF